jgi:hypothetical protein
VVALIPLICIQLHVAFFFFLMAIRRSKGNTRLVRLFFARSHLLLTGLALPLQSSQVIFQMVRSQRRAGPSSKCKCRMRRIWNVLRDPASAKVEHFVLLKDLFIGVLSSEGQ